MPDSGETGPHSSGAHDTVSDAAPVKRSVQLERGSLLGRYVVLEPIGSGGMSIVYAAYDPELDRKVAIKVVRGRSDGSAGLHERERLRLLREAQAMARLTHPNVMPIYDAGSFGDRVFLAMHFVEGQTLTQWLAKARPWRQIVEFFVYAGRGLAAAHASGLVHRDFKPDNVLVDGDARVRVTDFGLARPSEGPRSIDENDPSRGAGTAAISSSRLERPVTIAGAVLGTPAYMSPEQHLAGEVDARTDQFSFCVALWEALAGERPFAGDTVGELAFAVTRGRMRPFPREAPVPNRIRRALERGLSRAPGERYETMGALLDALAPRGRRPALLIGGAIALVGLGAVLPMLGSEPAVVEDRCVSAGAGLDAIYDSTKRKQIADAITATGGLGASATERVLTVIDRRAEDWREAATAACIAHRIDGTESAPAFDARMRCLDRRRAEIADIVGRLERADEQGIASIASAVFDQISALECNDTERLLEARPPPDDPAVRARADAIDTALDSLLASIESDDDTLALAAELVDDAKATGWETLISRALVAQAMVHEARGETSEGELMLREAARAAARAGNDAEMLGVLGELAYSLAHLQNRLPEALEVAYLMELEITRIEGSPRVPGLLAALGAVYQAANQLERAEAAYLGALALLDSPDRENPIRRAVVLNNLGTIALTQGDALAAMKFFEQALELSIATHGESYLHISDNYVNLCEARLIRGELDLARPLCERALALVDGPRPRDAAAAARALHSLATLEMSVGNFDAARVAIDRARPLMIAAFGRGSYPHGATEYADAVLHQLRGDIAGAKRLALEADAMLAAAGSAAELMRASSLTLLGTLASLEGKPTEALVHCEAALALLAKGVAADHPVRLEPLNCRGEALVALGRGPVAATTFEETLAIYDKRAGDPYLVARARFGLTKLVAASDPTRARTLALAAREDLRPVAKRSPAFTTELDAWLETHR